MVAVELPVNVRAEFPWRAMYAGRLVHLNGMDVGGSQAQELMRNTVQLTTQYGRSASASFLVNLFGIVTTQAWTDKDSVSDLNEALAFRGMKVLPYFSEQDREGHNRLAADLPDGVLQRDLNELIAEDASEALARTAATFGLPDGSQIALSRLRFVSCRFDAQWVRETNFMAEYGG